MKYIKFFEELNPDTYIKVGKTINKTYNTKRGNDLIYYGNSLKYNVSVNKDIDVKEYKYILNVDSYENKPLNCKFINYNITSDCVYGDISVEEFVEMHVFICYKISFLFETMDGRSVMPFDFIVTLYNGNIENRKLNNYITIMYPYDNGKIPVGIFADRKSANMFLKEIVSKIPDDSDFPASEIVSLLGKPSSDLEQIYNMFTNIDVRYLYNEDFSVLNSDNEIVITK